MWKGGFGENLGTVRDPKTAFLAMRSECVLET